MKSETYQKEGWFILEEENQVFGKNAEAVENNENLESEDFNFYHQNKEEAKNNIDSSSKDLTDFIDSLIQDVPAPSEEEVNAGIDKILEITHLVEEQPKTNQKKKVTFRVLFIAALLSVISFSCIYVVGSSHNISIENGFISFAKDTIQIIFFNQNEEEYITVDALLTDLELHGYDDILFPQEFVTKSDEYKVSIPEYWTDEIKEQVSFEIRNAQNKYAISINKAELSNKAFSYNKPLNADTIVLNDVHIYAFEFGGVSTIEFIYNDISYYINAEVPYSDIVKIAESIK